MVSQLRRHRALPILRYKLDCILILVRSNEDTIALIAQIVGALKVSKDRQLDTMLLVIGLHLWHGLCDNILMLQDYARCLHASELTDTLAPQACCIDDTVCHNNMVFLFGVAFGSQCHLPLSIRHGLHPNYLCMLIDFAAKVSALACKCLRYRGGAYVAISLCVQGSDQTIGVNEWVQLLGSFRGDQVELWPAEEALIELRFRKRVQCFLHALLILYEPDRAWLVERERDAFLVLPLLVELSPFLVPELEVVAPMIIGHLAC